MTGDSAADRETAYLLRSPENARRLLAAVAYFDSEKYLSAPIVKSIEELREMVADSELDR